MSEELAYLLVVIGLFIVPRVLQRVRIPPAITCVAIGAALGIGLGLFPHDPTIKLLATLGIVALFLFAGLEVDFDELRDGIGVTLWYLVVQVALLVVGAWVLGSAFSLSLRAALLFSLAVFTPSTGFILDSLPGFGLSRSSAGWVKTKAIASELVALAALFAVVRSASAAGLGGASAALLALVLGLPVVFQTFVSRVLPYAPKSEFAFLIILALLCAYVTRHLGVYYLVGAFLVGVTAVRLRRRLPALAAPHLQIGIEQFATFFVPFYFFKAGLTLEPRYFTLRSVLIGLALVALVVPLRIGTVALLRWLLLREPIKEAGRVGLALVPTLVFSLVLANILRESYGLAPDLFGSLVVFALLCTAVPGFVLRRTRGVPLQDEVGATLAGLVALPGATSAEVAAATGTEPADSASPRTGLLGGGVSMQPGVAITVGGVAGAGDDAPTASPALRSRSAG